MARAPAAQDREVDAVTRRGVCVWLTGLSGAGKSTIAGILARHLESRDLTVTLLDGDVVRTHLSKGLGFSKDDRDTNIRRIGFVAAEIVRHGGVVICAAVSPFESTRNEVKQQVGPDSFLLVYVATPLEECERRDTKGLYAKARRGEIKGLTGIDDPYEQPSSPDIVMQTIDRDADACASQIERLLEGKGFI